MINYNTFHLKNVNTQLSPINSRNYTYQSLISIINDYFKFPRGYDDVLDFGCGVGTIDFYLSRMGYGVLGVDISTRAIRLARKSGKAMGMTNVAFESSSLENFSTMRKFR
jgi:tRNA/tmRNA/rRNA uracil-C5-methylase (TrmA/RlmC/RlmD family)